MSVVSVIGAGPVGLHCASILKEEGFEVSVFEEHGNIGRPVQCAGLISKAGIEELGLKLDDSVVNQVKGAKIFSPGGESITVEKKETVAFVVDRFLFDQVFYKKAKRLGCDIHLNKKLIDLRGSNLFMESSGHGELHRSKIVIGADGAHSVVRHSAFKRLDENGFVQGFQARAEGNFDKNLVEMHFGNFAPGFFAWVIPESSTVARVGLGAMLGENTAENFERFIKEKGMEIKVLSKSSGLIPMAAPGSSLVAGTTLLVGDAAMQTKATTGGGIVFGLKAAEVCAGAVANHLKHQHSLNVYDKSLKDLNKELLIHWKIHSYIKKMRPEHLDKLFAKAKNAGIEPFLEEHGDMDNPSRFMRKMLFKPKMWGLLPAALRIV
ncbi:MAG: NAD(P)/FAD-dependent oxidoreductase [Candidatus Diapherotrites archaeon]|uniref:NAD(P)/FAD-dependent oxidoreductase n=1 Tax=Candidatus Iainarchaeum sp. TaxID=3101447 RepID=A0A938YX30_9ARCH|nr:NAD(P)/FAD-dependent oxidoreductase [Candidatus Diapherotrites archaeon]